MHSANLFRGKVIPWIIWKCAVSFHVLSAHVFVFFRVLSVWVKFPLAYSEKAPKNIREKFVFDGGWVIFKGILLHKMGWEWINGAETQWTNSYIALAWYMKNFAHSDHVQNELQIQISHEFKFIFRTKKGYELGDQMGTFDEKRGKNNLWHVYL